MQQCTGSIRVWLLAEPIKSNWPNVRTWSVFQYPVTFINALQCNIAAHYNIANTLLEVGSNPGMITQMK